MIYLCANNINYSHRRTLEKTEMKLKESEEERKMVVSETLKLIESTRNVPPPATVFVPGEF